MRVPFPHSLGSGRAGVLRKRGGRAGGERGVDDAHAAAPEFGERLEVRAVERGQTVRLGRGGRTPRERIQPGGKAFQVIGKFRRSALRRASIPAQICAEPPMTAGIWYTRLHC